MAQLEYTTVPIGEFFSGVDRICWWVFCLFQFAELQLFPSVLGYPGWWDDHGMRFGWPKMKIQISTMCDLWIFEKMSVSGSPKRWDR